MRNQYAVHEHLDICVLWHGAIYGCHRGNAHPPEFFPQPAAGDSHHELKLHLG